MNPRLVLLQHSNKRAWVYPEHGFQLYGFEQVFGEQVASVIYAPDQQKESLGRRYGNPILFPSVSPTHHSEHGLDAWVWRGKIRMIPSHGLARNMYWHVLDMQSDRITAEFLPNSSTELAFPFDFRLQLTYQLDDRGLVLDAELQNTGKDAFPYSLGFHPYLRTPIAAKGTVADWSVALPSGVRAESVNQWKSHELTPFKAQQIQADYKLDGSILLTKTDTRSLELKDDANRLVTKVSVENSEQSMPVWVIWSPSSQTPYICLEPWTDVPNGLNRSETRRCSPGQTHRYQMILSVSQ